MQTNIQQNNNTLRSWIVVLTSALFFFYCFIQINLFNAIAADLAKELHFTTKQISEFFASFSLGMILFLFPAGLLIDRFSVSKLLFAVFVISITSTFIISATSSFWVMNFARLIAGTTAAFAALSCIKLVSRWIDPKQMGSATSAAMAIGTIGGIIAQAPLAIITQKFGWRATVQAVAFIGIALLMVQLLIVRDKPRDLKNILDKKINRINFWRSLSTTIFSKQNWLCSLFLAFMNLPILIWGGVWGIPYLNQVHNLSHVQSATLTGMIFMGLVIGSPLVGIISDYIGRRKLVMIVGSTLSALVLGAIMLTPSIPFILGIFLYIALGLFLSSNVIGYPVITESNPLSITATANGLAAILIMIGGALSPLFGRVLELSGKVQIIESVSVYTSGDFIRANYILLGGLVIALMSSLLIKETYCKPIVKISDN